MLDSEDSEMFFFGYKYKVNESNGWDLLHLKSGGGLSMSTVVIFRATVFSSASRYRSMKYSWVQGVHLGVGQLLVGETFTFVVN